MPTKTWKRRIDGFDRNIARRLPDRFNRTLSKVMHNWNRPNAGHYRKYIEITIARARALLQKMVAEWQNDYKKVDYEKASCWWSFQAKTGRTRRTPSENAWLKIQEKQSAKSLSERPVRRVGWYAAAGVATAVMGGYLVWQNQQGVSPGERLNRRKTIAAVKPAHRDSVIRRR